MGYKAVIVDDEEPALRIAKRLVERNSSIETIFTAGNAKAGLQHLTDNDVALLLTDTEMAGMNGPELIKVMLKLYADKTQPSVIMLSGNPDYEVEYLSVLQEAGAYFVHKMVMFNTLPEVIQSALADYEARKISRQNL